LVVLAGVEITAAEGHFLSYGVNNPFAIAKGIGVADLCREVHRQGGAVVAAHPFRWGQPFDAILREEQPELDGLELMTDHMDAECRKRAAEVFRGHRLAGLGSSDAHQVELLGACYSEFEPNIRTNQDLVMAIRGRRVVARERAAART
jgi:predicted metal-dependent phosphoesterase TrpH